MAIMSQRFQPLFTKKNVAASKWVYTDAGGATSSSGWVNARGDYTYVQIRCATKTSAAAVEIKYRIEGKLDSSSRTASIATGKFTAVKTSDQLITVSEKLSSLRLGLKASKTISSPLGSLCRVYAGFGVTEVV